MFKVIKDNYEIKDGNSVNVRTMDGFEFIPGTRESSEEYRAKFSENRWEDEKDSFFDGDCNKLCIDENGNFYSVMFDYETGKPGIWCKVRPI